MKHFRPGVAYDFLRDVINVLEGFEGPLDEHHQRGRRSGWRKDGLPWEQT